MNTLKPILAVICVLLLVIATVHAQEARGTISGTVTEASGGVVPGVSLTLTNKHTGVAFESISNETGQYRFPLLNPGTYLLVARLPVSRISSVIISGFTLTRPLPSISCWTSVKSPTRLR